MYVLTILKVNKEIQWNKKWNEETQTDNEQIGHEIQKRKNWNDDNNNECLKYNVKTFSFQEMESLAPVNIPTPTTLSDCLDSFGNLYGKIIK